MLEIINFSTVYLRRKRGWHPRSTDCWKTCCHQTKMKTRPQDLSRTPPSQLPSQRCSVSQVTVDAELGPQQSNAEHSAPHLVKDPLRAYHQRQSAPFGGHRAACIPTCMPLVVCRHCSDYHSPAGDSNCIAICRVKCISGTSIQCSPSLSRCARRVDSVCQRPVALRR